MVDRALSGARRMKARGKHPVQVWASTEEQAMLRAAAAQVGRPVAWLVLNEALATAAELLGWDHKLVVAALRFRPSPLGSAAAAPSTTFVGRNASHKGGRGKGADSC